MKKKICTYTSVLIVLVVLLLTACNKESLESPLTKTLDYEDIKTVDVLNSVLNSGYRILASDMYYGRYVILVGEVRSENCVANLSSSPYPLMEEYNTGLYLSPQNYDIQNLWNYMYRGLAAINAVIAHADVKLEGDAKQQGLIVGQAYALRALYHYDLLRLFGAQHAGSTVQGIPYVTTYPTENTTPARTPVAEIHTQLYQDLDKAILLLKSQSVGAGATKMPEQVYMNYYAAHVLRARIALWFGDWDIALNSLQEVENSHLYRILTKVEYVEAWKKKKNTNSIFELAITAEVMNNQLSLAQLYNGGLLGDISATKYLKDLFEPTDVRGGEQMIGENKELRKTKEQEHKGLATYLANLGKYPDHVNNTDNIVLMRFEEVLLMKAETLFRKGDAAGALAALNEIANARGATPHSAATEDAILLERQKELCFEGFRFDDLARFKRSVDPASKIDEALLFKLPYTYGTKVFTLPIPDQELRANPALRQTDGY